MKDSHPLLLAAAAFALGVAATQTVAAWPPGFADTTIGSGWNQPTGMTYAEFEHTPGEDSRLIVWEKGGRVWQVENGVRDATPMINISEEVGDWRDYGLLGLAVDPEFHHNGYIYLLYAVDYHHARYFGTPEYDANANEYFRDTIGRITRYTCDPATGFRSVIPESRTVLIGDSLSTGFPLCHQSHGVGSLVFGEDGSLLASCGDAGSYEALDTGGPTGGSSNTALADGVIRPAEDVGAYRAQLINGLNGKVIRINPETGAGMPDNPFYDAANPSSPQSRVWALGFRNPFRFCIRPGSASAESPPGVVYLGDVGWFTWEELNVIKGPGRNFGWPAYEGMQVFPAYNDANVQNRDVPNPLFGEGSCAVPYLYFRNMLVQDTLGTPSWTNPCNFGEQIPESIPRFVHTRPAVDWSHGGTARVGTYNGDAAATCNIGDPGCVPGSQFVGFSSTGGMWYTGSRFPSIYHNTYFHADYAGRWIKNFVFDENNDVVEVRDFQNDAGAIVDMIMDPNTGDLLFIDYDDTSGRNIHRLAYVDNAPPSAVASAEPNYGPTPLTVQFSSAGSSDPENQSLTYDWDFGDGSPHSSLANPTHVYDAVGDITSEGAIITRVFELNPPHPIGGGNWDPEVIRDGVYPAVGGADPLTQYDTYHANQQGSVDYIGYSFEQPRRFSSLIYQEGMHFFDGGWFDSFVVQVLVGSTWTNVSNYSITPAYPFSGAGPAFQSYALSFTPITGTAVRIVGDPGGAAGFISVGELRVFASLSDAAPASRTAVLTVTDPLGGAATSQVPVYLNNSPPTVEITSPPDGASYNICGSVTIPLTSTYSDAESSNDELTCRWQTILHHNDHVHPEPLDYNCETSTVLSPHGNTGEVYYFEIILTVTDPSGLAAARSVVVHPYCCPGDLDNDGKVTSQDYFIFIEGFFQGDADINNDGFTDSQDFFFFSTHFFEGC